LPNKKNNRNWNIIDWDLGCLDFIITIWIERGKERDRGRERGREESENES
jgi:hypothetical protein